ncbi:hypothetical protein P8452_77360 [Trifolium repens]|nr:factor of DNA methylation [Trifolium repens]WJX96114.1 hypothetical protein P8452_77360 [Trifolium repens]
MALPLDSLDTETGHDKSSTIKTDHKSYGDELFVWPWTVILANNVEKLNTKTVKYVRKNEQEIKKQLCSKEFKFSKVLVFGNNTEHTEFSIVKFGKESTDFDNVVTLEEAFKKI